MNKMREMFKANVISLKIQKLVIKESVECSPRPEHARPGQSMLAHARACSPLLDHARPCSNMLTHA